MSEQIYFLSSLESARFEEVRECFFVKQMTFSTGKECALVRVDPPVNGQAWGLATDLEYFVLANRHEGEHLFPISTFPCFVHIARSFVTDLGSVEILDSADVETVAWGEIYRTRADAEKHSFGNE